MVPGGTTYRVIVATKSGTLLKWRVYTIDPSTAGGVAANGKAFANAASSSAAPITEVTLAGTPTMNIAASSNLKYFFIYGKQDTTKSTFYAVGRLVNWDDNTATVADQTIDTSVGGGFLTSAELLAVSVSERFLYARTSADHAGFLISGNKLTVQFAKTTFSAITNLQNSFVYDNGANNFFNVFQTKFVAASAITSVDSLVSAAVPTAPAGTV